MESSPTNPFKGLRPYLKEDEHKLFGRDRDHVLIKTRIVSGRTTLLFAGSGVGKTSFLNAKVIPQFQQQHCVILHNRWTGVDEVADVDMEEPEDKFWPPWTALVNLVRRFIRKQTPQNPRPADLPPSAGQLTFEERLAEKVQKTIAQCLSPNRSGATGLSEALAIFKRLPETTNVNDDEEEEEEEGTDLPTPDAGSGALSQSPEKSRSRLSEQTAGELQKKSVGEPLEKLEKDRCILILDQFEEVFQYHSNEPYFDDFIKDLCSIINDDDFHCRVVFSMREEFLGELSIFDNRIPDLFSNYYRLKHPTKDEAKDIIKRTCGLVPVEIDAANLSLLIEDLSRFEKGPASLEKSPGADPSEVKVFSRNFVAPPYLQIACDRLWNEQYQIPDTPPPNDIPATPMSTDVAVVRPLATAVAEPRDDTPVAAENSRKSLTPFLSEYHINKPESENGYGGGAQRVLREFCKEKLSAPFLTPGEQNLAARAFSFLVTKQGAKMAYELSSLAGHMEVKLGPLKTTLRKLSQPDARLLRESRGIDRSYWFELYHDMYAAIVDDWKHAYLRLKKKADRRKLLTGAISSSLLIVVLMFALFHWVVNPLENRKILIEYRGQTAFNRGTPGLIDPRAVQAYQDLRRPYRGYADGLWASILEQRARQFEQIGDRDRAFLTLLKAASLRAAGTEQQSDLSQAELLMGDDSLHIEATYGDNVKSLALSPDLSRVLTINPDDSLTMYNQGSFKPLFSFCRDCEQAIFASNGKAVITLSEAMNEASPNRSAGNRTQSRRSQENSLQKGNSKNSQSGGPSDSSGLESSPSPSPVTDQKRFEARVWNVESEPALRKTIILLDIPVKKSAATAGKRNDPGRTGPILLSGLLKGKSLAKGAKDTSREQGDSNPSSQDMPKLVGAVSFGDQSGEADYLIAGIVNSWIIFWQASTGYLVFGQKFDQSEPTSVSSSRDGRFIAVTFDSGKTSLLEVLGNQVRRVPLEKPLGVTFAFSPDSRTLLGLHDDGLTRLSTLASGKSKAVTIATEGKPRCVAFSPSGEEFVVVTTAGSKGAARVFSTSSLKSSGNPLEIPGLMAIDGVAFGADAKDLLISRTLVTTSMWNATVERWDLKTRQQTGSLRLQAYQEIPTPSFNSNSVVALVNGRARSWRIEPVESTTPSIGAENALRFAGVSDDGTTILTRTSTGYQLWNSLSRQSVCTVQTEIVDSSPTLSPNGKYFAVLPSDQSVQLWYRDTCKSETVNLESVEEPTFAMKTFSPDSRLLAIPRKNETIIFEVSSRTELARLKTGAGISEDLSIFAPSDPRAGPPLKTRTGIIEDQSFSPDRKYFVALFSDFPFEKDAIPATFRRIRVWQLPEGTEINLAGKMFADLWMPALNSQARMVTWGGDNVARLWDLSVGDQIKDFAHETNITVAVFNPQGTSVITADESGVVRVWDVVTATMTDEMHFKTRIIGIKFSSDGQRLLIREGLWLHRLALPFGKLQYLGAIVDTRYLVRSLAIDSPQGNSPERIRFIRSSPPKLEVVAINPQLNQNTILTGDAETLFQLWQQRLAMGVGEFGEVQSLYSVLNSIGYSPARSGSQ